MKIVAHRGYSARFPENSQLAFERAIAAGADYLETDVRIAADGTPVCWHDPDLARVAGVPDAIAAIPAARLSAIALPGGARVHRLDEVLALARGRIPVLLDVKVDHDEARATIARTVAAAAMTDQVVYGVRNPQHARALHADGACFARLAMPARPEALAEFPLQYFIGARLWEDQVDDAAMMRIRGLGLAVWVTAGLRREGEVPGHIAPERLQQLGDRGVDAVLVNDPALARAVAKEPSCPQ